MSEKKNPQSISRRKFLKDLGTGVVGTSVALQGIKGITQAQESQGNAPPHTDKTAFTLKVNGQEITALVAAQTSLADFLRNQLQLTGTKVVCNHGECGACTVLLDGRAVYSCHMLALDAANKEVITIEGL